MLSANAKDRNQSEWMRADEVHLQASAVPAFITPERMPTQTMVAVPDELLASVRAVLPNAQVHQVAVAAFPGPGAAQARWQVDDLNVGRRLSVEDLSVLMSGSYPLLAVVVDDSLLELYPLSPPAREALSKDGIVGMVSGRRNGVANLRLVGGEVTGSNPHELTYDAELIPPFPVTVVAQEDLPLGALPRILVTAERARSLGLDQRAGVTVVRASSPLTSAQRAAVQDTIEEHRDIAIDAVQPGGSIISVSDQLFYPSNGLSPRLLEALLTAAAFMLSLFVVAVSLALAAAETRDERDVLVVVGAPPPTMRGTSGRKALLLTLLGAALAIPVGFLPVSVFTAASSQDLPLVFPWRLVLLLVVAVPVVSGLVTTACSGLALRLRPVHVSTMAFD
jgi:hypothetical protein